MKKTLILTTALMALLLAARAQNVHYGEYFELNSTLNASQSHEYTASDYIDLNTGFHSEPGSGNNALLQLDSEGYSIYPPEVGLTDNGGCVVGSLGGTVNVGAMGGLVYSIPLELPAGINGMQPSLAITYNSQAGNGLLGWGWYLDGLSSITRTGKTLYHDGEMTAANLSWNDRFLLDGKRLVEVADYTDSIEYRIEQDEMTKIMAYKERMEGALGLLGIKKLARFIVWRSDEIIMEYGATEDSWINSQTNPVHPLSWQLNKLTDRYGNSVLYHYNESAQIGECFIDAIEYTVNDGQNIPAQFTVSFQYQENRQDFERYYIGENQIMMRHLLENITVTSKTIHKPLCKYVFQYEWNNKRLYNILSNVSMKSYDENSMMETIKSTSFEWGPSSLCEQLQYSTINSEIFEDFPFTGDFNGDGYTDVAMVPYKDSTVYDGPVDICIYLNDRNHGFIPAASMNLSGMPASLDWIHVLDINGDGLDDLVPYFYDTVPASGTEKTTVMVYLNNYSTQSFSYVGFKEINSKGDVITGNFNGDGTMDVILLEKVFQNIPINPGIGWYERMPYINNAFFIGYINTAFQISQLNNTTLEGLGPAYNIIAADFNGDGTTEVLLASIKLSDTDYHGSKIAKFDFNDSSDCLKIIQSFPKQYEYPYQYIGNEANWCHIFPGDFNGDGKADVIYHNLGVWRMCLSVGDSLGMPYLVSNPELPHLNQYYNLYYPSLRIIRQTMTNPYMMAFTVNDFDGDGCSDVGFTSQSNSSKLYFYSKISTETHSYRFRKYFRSQDDIQFHSQFIHVGNFLGRDNPSFLCSLQPDKEGKSSVATIHTLYSINRYNALMTATDGLGNLTSFAYDYLTPKASGSSIPFYTHTYAAPDANGVLPVPIHARALKTCTVQGVNGSSMITAYRYHNAMYHKYGHGFMGFESTVAETYHNSTDSLWTTRKVSWNEKSTMGSYAMMLPQCDTVYVNCNGVKRIADRTQYYFTNAKLASGLTDLVVCPAMTDKAEDTYSMDNAGELLQSTTTSYQYNYASNHTYTDAYGCTSSTQIVTGFLNGNPITELQTTKVTELQTIGSSWIVNRPVSETVTSTRNSEPRSTKTCYTYVSNNSYQPQTVTVIPNDGTQSNDPLTVSTVYGYDAFGNVTDITTSAPYGTHGEQTRTTSYEYGSSYQHRLVTKETKGLASDGYVTEYEYDFHDRPSSVTDCNGKHTGYSSSVLRTDQSVLPPDGTEQRSLTLWADDSPYKPEGACYYTWSKKTGGVTVMTFYHKSGAELRNVTFDFQGNPVFTDKHYNAKGLLDSVSAPYKRGEPAGNIQWTVYHYDAHDRMTRIDNPDGSKKTIAYDGLETTTTVTPPQGSPVMTPQSTVKKTNAMGWLRESVDANGTSVFYEYYADGNLKWTRVGNDDATKIRLEYDHAGNRTLLHDPDYCTATKDLVSVYNAFGEEVGRTTPRDVVSSFTYDKFGRMTQRTEDNKTTVWAYGSASPNRGLLLSVTYPGQTVTYTYDTCQRVVRETVQFSGGETHVTQYSYDRASRIASMTYPSGFTVIQRYNTIGYPSVQTDGQNNELYRTESTTPMGQMERFTLGGVLTNTLEYDSERHLLTRIKTKKNNSTKQNFSFTYDGFCNLASRKDHVKNLTERFQYDSQNRLTEVWLGTTQTGASAYDSYGRMTSKSAGGQAVFSSAMYSTTAKPHALDAATTAEGVFPATAQTVTYTGFDKADKIKQGNDSICYTYGYDHQRIFMEEHIGSTVRTKRYVGNCEYVTETMGNTTASRWLTYLTGSTGVYAVVVTANNANTIHYILKDNLGSWTAITSSSGTVEQRLSFDAWGNLRNPNSWSGSFTGTPMFDRGFTGHEHLYAFGLINMNGRMYDPITSSFLSVDQYVGSPENAQGFNRYAYCSNNPLRYVDPSGWLQVGGGASGYTPNSSANANDPYAYAEHGSFLEPRDLGLRQLSTTDPVITWMEENSLHGGGKGGNGITNPVTQGDEKKYRFGFGDPNAVKVKGIGACLFASLGMVCKRLNHWDLDPVFWKEQEEFYFAEKKQHGYDSNNVEDYIQWVGEKNNITFIFEKILMINIPDAYNENSQILIVMQLEPEYMTQNEGNRGHVAVLNTFSQSSVMGQITYSMTFGDPSPQRFLYPHSTKYPNELPTGVNSWLLYKFNINFLNKQ